MTRHVALPQARVVELWNRVSESSDSLEHAVLRFANLLLEAAAAQSKATEAANA